MADSYGKGGPPTSGWPPLVKPLPSPPPAPRPARHWSGQTVAAAVLRRQINNLPSPYYLSDEDAYELAGSMLHAYLEAIREDVLWRK